jgi:hypothetical protein
LSDRRREERDEELAETCRVFEDFNAQIVKDWSVTENENWPA